MKYVIAFSLCFFSLYINAQEYYSFVNKKDVLTKAQLEEKITDVKNKFSKKNKDSLRVLDISYEILKTFQRNDSTIHEIKYHFNFRPSKLEAIYAWENKSFPDFELKNLKSKTITKADLKDKVTFINIWYTECVPCVREIPSLNKLKDKYQNDVRFMAITFEQKKKLKDFLKKTPYNFEHLINAKPFLKDTLGIVFYPKIMILDKDGQVKYVGAGIPPKFDKNNKVKDIQDEDFKYLEDILKKLI